MKRWRICTLKFQESTSWVASDNYIYKTMKTKKKIKPKTKRKRNIAKSRNKKHTKRLTRKSLNKSKSNSKRHLKWWGFTTINDEQEGIESDEDGNRTYPEGGEFDAYLHAMNQFNWVGMISLKFHHHDYSGDDRLGLCSKRRFEFANMLIKNLCNRWFGVKESKLVWVACEEFGISNDGHIHIVFSFDSLKPKDLHRVSQINFLDDEGDFYKMGVESCEHLRMIINEDFFETVKMNQVDFNWKAQWDNEGLSRYMSKIEYGRNPKKFELHNILSKESELLVTK